VVVVQDYKVALDTIIILPYLLTRLCIILNVMHI